MPEPLLSVRDLSVSYGRAQAVTALDLAVAAGEFVAMLGANGAGKSSTLLAVSGVVPFEGSVRFDGVELRGRNPEDMVRLGLVQVPERRAIFPDLTVEEHLVVGAWTRRPGPELCADRELVFEVLPRLADLRRRRAGSLSGGEQQMLVLAKALLASPRLLLIDELSLGLAPKVVADLLGLLARMNEQGLAILLVEQFADLALRRAQRAYVLEKGRCAFAGGADRLRQDRSVLTSSYLGGLRP